MNMYRHPLRRFAVIVTLFLSACGGRVPATDGSAPADAARAVVERTFGFFPRQVHFASLPAVRDGGQRYVLSVQDGCLTVKGSSPVAICKGFYEYIFDQGYGIASWTGNRLQLPSRLPSMEEKEVVSPYQVHLYPNVCAFGYTYPFWKWEQWEKEIDWMALHGFDMPVSPIGGEAVLARVWKGMGFSDEEIKDYWTGPAHLPWMRMGNLDHHAGPVSDAWMEAQLELAHRIDARERELGMTPVYQGFAGFVPDAFAKHFPEASLTETHWNQMPKEDHNPLLSPMDPLFQEIGASFIREWEKEFGKGEYYLIDSFNEMQVPFGPLGSRQRSENLAAYSRKMYESLSRANPDAVWVIQGWMFGYQREKEWDPASVRALLSGAPDDKMMIVDLAVDFNEYVWKSEKSWNYLDGFFGKKWIWSTTPNFGGRTALVGPLEFLLNAHLDAWSSPRRGHLMGFGTSPEGVENNEISYEVIARAGWSDHRVDLNDFLQRYTVARYGKTTAAMKIFWEEMLQSQYSNFTNAAIFHWQRRPPIRKPHRTNINEHYFKAIEAFLGDRKNFAGNALYETDAIAYGALYLAAKADIVLDSLYVTVEKGDMETTRQQQADLLQLLSDTDRLLESHPLYRAQRWMDMARQAAFSRQEADRFELEAKELISVWGGTKLFDYSCRVWSGLIRDYYIPRLKHWFDNVLSGVRPDMAAFDAEGFATHPGLSPQKAFEHPVETAARLVQEAR